MSSSIINDLLKKYPYIKIKNPQEVERKINKIISDGYDKLLIVSDFDYTLSKFKDANGKECLITHSIFVKCTKEIRPELAENLEVLVKKYSPIECCKNLTKAEKIPKMEDYWRKAHEYIINSDLSYSDIEGFTLDAPLYLRDEALEFIKLSKIKNVPLIIFSAGIGNIIEMILEKKMDVGQKELPNNLHIISNFMNFNQKNDICESFTEPLIHSFCKNSASLTDDKEKSYSNEIKSRPNVLLLGDSIEDVHMDIGIVNESTALKIGYLNHSFDDRFENYFNAFDILLIDCPSMEVPIEIFNLLNQKQA